MLNCGTNPEGVPGILGGSEGTGGGGDAARGVTGRSFSFFAKSPRRLRRDFKLAEAGFEPSSKSFTSSGNVYDLSRSCAVLPLTVRPRI